MPWPGWWTAQSTGHVSDTLWVQEVVAVCQLRMLAHVLSACALPFMWAGAGADSVFSLTELQAAAS